MSPYELWRSASAATSIRLPSDPDELDVICSDAVTCTLTTKGIEVDNCIFNSDHLQAILRQAPRKPNQKTVSVPVQVRLNRSLMAFIWVTDPRSGERLQVPNIDRTKAGLSAFQVKVACRLQRKARDHGQKISLSQAIKRARESARDLSQATTQGARRRMLRVTGLSLEESTTVPEAPSTRRKSVRKRGNRGNGTSKKSTTGTLGKPINRRPASPRVDDDIPFFTTVVRAPKTLTGRQS
ncbi:hypothetical protein FHT32_003307 [Variovorax sp. SG517]|uniref:hypothetical protein n=1 Tax=Variovorax sp. SG517 TaxID=2587117 RepID=UPI00159DF5C3|nr:hypothetical protein [Variovorax sp. SG517]NVM89650.1 hypothetical protein [Variovorax sp. SG517]